MFFYLSLQLIVFYNANVILFLTVSLYRTVMRKYWLQMPQESKFWSLTNSLSNDSVLKTT